MLHYDLCRMPLNECRGNFGQLHGLCIYRQCGRCSRRAQVRLMQPCASAFLWNTFGHDGGEIWEVQRPLAQMLDRLVVHDSEQLPWSWCDIDFAGSRMAENIAPHHDGDLHLLRWRAIAQASRGVFAMYNIMAHGAEVPDIERTRPLRKADAAPIFQFHLQKATSKQRQPRMKKRCPPHQCATCPGARQFSTSARTRKLKHCLQSPPP